MYRRTVPPEDSALTATGSVPQSGHEVGPKSALSSVRRELEGFAASGALSDWTRFWAVLPDTLHQNVYGTLSLFLDSLENAAAITPSSPKGWVRWAQVRAGVAVRAGDYSTGARYFRSAREAVSPDADQELWATLACREIGCLVKESRYDAVLATIEDLLPRVPFGSQRILEGWAGRLRYRLGRLKWDSTIDGTFLKIGEGSGMSSVIYRFIRDTGDTLSIETFPGTVLRRSRDVWTPGGLGWVFDIDDPPKLEGARRIEFQPIGHRARVHLIHDSLAVLVEFAD